MIMEAFGYSISQEALLLGSASEPVIEDHVPMFQANRQ
jgi:hypothetical protein